MKQYRVAVHFSGFQHCTIDAVSAHMAQKKVERLIDIGEGPEIPWDLNPEVISVSEVELA